MAYEDAEDTGNQDLEVQCKEFMDRVDLTKDSTMELSFNNFQLEITVVASCNLPASVTIEYVNGSEESQYLKIRIEDVSTRKVLIMDNFLDTYSDGFYPLIRGEVGVWTRAVINKLKPIFGEERLFIGVRAGNALIARNKGIDHAEMNMKDILLLKFAGDFFGYCKIENKQFSLYMLNDPHSPKATIKT